MDQGRVLYRDFWDLKPPGIFLFYWVSGHVVGFDGISVHLFELGFMSAFGVLLVLVLKPRFHLKALSALLPLATVGVYYSVCWSWHLTQVEGLIGPFLFLSLWLSLAPPGQRGTPRRWPMVLSGLVGGVVLLFKPLFLLLLCGFWIPSLVRTITNHPLRRWSVAWGQAAAVVGGIALPLLAVVASFADFGALSSLCHTLFVIPSRVLSEMPPVGMERLRQGLFWFLTRFGPLFPPAAIGAWTRLRGRADPLGVGLVLWILVGLGVILLQRQSWWEYHYLLLLVPFGILAVFGVDSTIAAVQSSAFFRARPRRWALLALVGLLILPFARAIGSKSLKMAKLGGVFQHLSLNDYRTMLDPHYGVALRETAFLRSTGSLPGDIYVLGDPEFYVVSGRGQQISLSGWGPELFLPEQWATLARELEARPPTFLFIAEGAVPLISARSPETGRMLERVYVPVKNSSNGVWYSPR